MKQNQAVFRDIIDSLRLMGCVRTPSQDDFASLVEEVKKLSQAFAKLEEFQNYCTHRIDAALKFIVSMGRLQFDQSLEIRGDRTALDGLAAGLNMLNEELRHSIVSKEELDVALRHTQNLERKFRSVFEQEAVAVLFVSLEGVILESNRKYASLFGLTPEQVVGRFVIDLIHPEDRSQSLEGLRKMSAGEIDQFTAERRYFGSDGSVRWNLLKSSVVKDEAGHRKYFVSILQDITDQKNLEQALREAKADAEGANLAKSSFLANMSHEIRTPLGAIVGFAELIAENKANSFEKKNYFAAIKRNSELLSGIINDILDLSKVEAGKLQVLREETSLADILRDVAELLEPKARSKGIGFEIDIGASVPVRICTDSIRLKQILINLAGNAIKFTDEGSVKLIVHESTTSLLEIIVSDTGPGIKSEEIYKLFQPFSQADTTMKRNHGGTGLGLFLSKRLANLLGGDVNLVATRIGEGSTFSITIDPCLNLIGRQEQESVKKNAHASVQRLPRLDGKKILLAEDSPDIQFLVSRFLAFAGAEVHVASNGREAFEKIKGCDYDIVLMDLQMPVMDGFEAAAALREHGFTGKIIALTAHAFDSDRKKCLRSGFDDYLSKPISRTQLIERCAS